MPGESLLYIAIIALVGSAALFTNYFIARKEHQGALRSARLQWLQTQTVHVLDTISILRSAGCKTDIVERLNQHALLLIEEISLLAPDSDLMAQVNNQKESVERTAPDQARFSNDRDLKKLQIYINYTEKLLSAMVTKGELSAPLAKNYGKELYWLNIRTVADAHVQQGQRHLANDDKLTALSHFKHAKAVVVRAMVAQAQKQTMIDQIQPLIDAIQPKKAPQKGTLEDSLDSYLK